MNVLARSVVLALLATPFAAAQVVPGQPPPRLLLLVSVDQLASWVHAAAAPHFAPDGGFRRLAQQGAWFPQCAYRHACSETGPGHATIGTGAPASSHGIVRNDWWSPADGKVVYCAEDEVAALPEWPEAARRGPGRLMASTFADSLKAHVPGSKVASVAWKDRSAILMVGRAADCVAWFETSTGNLVTNRAWADEAPAWLQQFARERVIDRWFGQSWERVAPDAAYAGLVDDRPFETPHGNGRQQRTLPQPLTGGAAKPDKAYWSQLYASPFGNTMVRLAAEAAIDGLQLGADATPDLLCVGFSSTDSIGHAFGPDSVEARDAMLRLDADLGRLFAAIDQRLGTASWAVFLTADHGVGPTPEWAKAQRVDAGRGLLQSMVRAAGEKALQDRFGSLGEGRRFIAYVGDYGVFLDEAGLRAVAGAQPVDEVRLVASRLVATAAMAVRGIQWAIASTDLQREPTGGNPLREALLAGFYPGRGGDVQLVVKPYWVEGATPATHGSPHPYDREVVGCLSGPGIVPGTYAAAITPGFGAVAFARLLGIPVPAAAVDTIPAGLFGWR